MPILNMIYWATWWGGGGWTPDATRTIFYYDFEDSNNRLKDSSGNNNNATWTTAITYTTVGTQTVVEATWKPNGVSINWNCGSSIGTWDFTISFRVYPKAWNLAYIFNMSDSNYVFWPQVWFDDVNTLWQWKKRVYNLKWGEERHSWSATAGYYNSWHHIVFTRSSWSVVVYLDNNIDATWTDTTTSFPSSWWIGFLLGRTNSSWQCFNSWAMGDKYILENVAWSAQNVSDYFNQTKWDYWIS